MNNVVNGARPLSTSLQTEVTVLVVVIILLAITIMCLTIVKRIKEKD